MILARQLNFTGSFINKCFNKKFPSTINGWVFAKGEHEIDWIDLEVKYHEFYSPILCYDLIDKIWYIGNNSPELAGVINTSVIKIGKKTISDALKDKRYKVKDFLVFYKHDKSDKLLTLLEIHGLKHPDLK